MMIAKRLIAGLASVLLLSSVAISAAAAYASNARYNGNAYSSATVTINDGQAGAGAMITKCSHAEVNNELKANLNYQFYSGGYYKKGFSASGLKNDVAVAQANTTTGSINWVKGDFHAYCYHINRGDDFSLEAPQ